MSDVIRKSTNVLKMSFLCNANVTMTWNLKYPKDTLQKTDVVTAMNEMISEDLIRAKGSNEANEIKDVYIYRTQTIEIPTA